MNNCLNWRAKTSFETAIKETANWYLSANELNTLNISKEQVTKYFKKFSQTKSKKLVINNFKLEKYANKLENYIDQEKILKDKILSLTAEYVNKYGVKVIIIILLKMYLVK